MNLIKMVDLMLFIQKNNFLAKNLEEWFFLY